ncbi:MAG: hypothetical protein AAF460_15510, partial [Pseudomonadota bacterium]
MFTSIPKARAFGMKLRSARYNHTPAVRESRWNPPRAVRCRGHPPPFDSVIVPPTERVHGAVCPLHGTG